MAFFGVTVERIGEVRLIPDAERIELATLAGIDYQFVVGKGSFKPGAIVLYFPLDAVLPGWVIERLGLVGRLAGPQHNRIKTVKLRQQISQGIVASMSLFADKMDDVLSAARSTLSYTQCGEVGMWLEYQRNEDEFIGALTKVLGVTKYEPPVSLHGDAMMMSLPRGVSYYDIEGCERHADLVESLMEQSVFITEKLEGTNFSASRMVESDGSVRYYVNSHSKTIVNVDGKPECGYWQAARKQRLFEFLDYLSSRGGEHHQVTVYGELVGGKIQSNVYKLSQQKVFLFDIRLGDERGCWLNPSEFISAVREFYQDDAVNGVVPVLAIDIPLGVWLDGKTIKQASDGESKLGQTMREGIVVKPMIEQCVSSIGRLILKQRSPEYLAKVH